MKHLAKIIAATGVLALSTSAFAADHADFSKVDANGDGQVTFNEGKAVHSDWTQEAFNSLDTDKNGSLSEKEYKSAMLPKSGKKNM